MSKLVFFNIPAYGHTNPTLGVVRELVARGNQVWYYSFAPFQKVIQEAGATFVPCDDAALGMTPSPEDSARVGKDLAFSIDLIVRATLALDEKICRDMERIAPDGIVADSMAFWAASLPQNAMESATIPSGASWRPKSWGFPFSPPPPPLPLTGPPRRSWGRGWGTCFPWCGRCRKFTEACVVCGHTDIR